MLSSPPVKTAKKSQFYFITLIYFAEFYKKREKRRKQGNIVSRLAPL